MHEQESVKFTSLIKSESPINIMSQKSKDSEINKIVANIPADTKELAGTQTSMGTKKKYVILCFLNN